MKTTRRTKQLTENGSAETELVHVLVADSGPIQSQLLTRALKGRREFEVSAVALETSALRD
ncbi:MAG: hypothetical protein WBV31_10635, partial [Terriglobales bacterium]